MIKGPDPYKQMNLNLKTSSGSKKCQRTENTQIPKKDDVIDIKLQYNEHLLDLNSLSDDLNCNNPNARERALETLCRIKNEKVLSIMIDALKNKDTNIRWKAARYLGHFRNKDAVESLIETLKDQDFIVRNTAAWSLGEIGDEKAIEPLTHALEDENKYVKGSAKEAIEKIKKY